MRSVDRPAQPFDLRLRARACALCVALAALLAAGATAAEICKYADPEGTVHYSNMPPEKGWKKISCSESTQDAPQKRSGSAPSGNAPSGSTRPSSTVSSSTPAGFPRVDATTQRGRDDMRRRVLVDELNTEEKLLDEARNSYAAGVKPQGEEKSGDDKYTQRLNKLRQVIAVHQKNVDALRKEISGLK